MHNPHSTTQTRNSVLNIQLLQEENYIMRLQKETQPHFNIIFFKNFEMFTTLEVSMYTVFGWKASVNYGWIHICATPKISINPTCALCHSVNEIHTEKPIHFDITLYADLYKRK